MKNSPQRPNQTHPGGMWFAPETIEQMKKDALKAKEAQLTPPAAATKPKRPSKGLWFAPQPAEVQKPAEPMPSAKVKTPAKPRRGLWFAPEAVEPKAAPATPRAIPAREMTLEQFRQQYFPELVGELHAATAAPVAAQRDAA